MDIAVSSNFERFLFHMGGDDPVQMKTLMDNFESSGNLAPPASLVAASRAQMDSASVTDPEVLATIADTFKRGNGYVLDPHSAIGVAAAQKKRPAAKPTPMVCLACAHWAKFPDANAKALGDDLAKGLTVPEPLASLDKLPTRVSSQPNSVDGIQAFIRETLAKRGTA